MRALAWIGLVMVAVVGCKKSGGSSAIVAGLPVVSSSAVLATADGRPPKVVIVIDGDGAVRVADAPKTWDKLAGGNPKAVKPMEPRKAFELAHEASQLDMPVKRLLKDPDLAALSRDNLGEPYSQDDPPPPPPDEDSDDSGGTGTAMALDEGKMGQYEMKKPDDDPQLSRDQAIAAARDAGVLGRTGRDSGLNLGDDADSVLPARLADVVGKLAAHGVTKPDRGVLVMASPHAKAALLIDAVTQTSGLIGVAYQGKVRALRLEIPERSSGRFAEPGQDPAWIEVRVTTAGLEVEAVPDTAIAVPWANGGVDAAGLAKAYKETMDHAALDPDHAVDLLVAPETDVQRVVDIVVALDAAGAKVIGLGAAPIAGSPELAKRGKRLGTVQLGDPETSEDVDKAVLKDAIQSRMRGIQACYSGTLATNPDVVGTVQLRFYIDSGHVLGANATGLDDHLDACISSAVMGLELPTMSGVTAEVTYPLTLGK